MKIKYILLFVIGATVSIQAQKYQFKEIIDVEHTSVKNQGSTGTCWSFSASSFIESEISRMKGKTIDISEMYSVRMTYPDKAQNYVMRQGKAQFSEGGLAHDVMNSVSKYGLVPEETFSGLLYGQTRYNHSKIVPQIKEVLNLVIKSSANAKYIDWREITQSVLDKEIGKIPTEFTYEGKSYTPKSFLKMTGFNPNEYVTLTSFTHQPYFSKFILNIPDNFSYGTFNNIPLDDLVEQTKKALKKGYSVALDCDVSEKTFSSKHGVAVWPKNKSDRNTSLTEIVDEAKISADFREQEFNNFNTTDDHLMHIVGLVKDQKGNVYFKVKNSWGNSDRIGRGGFVYMSEAFFRLKTISVLLHKDAIDKKFYDF